MEGDKPSHIKRNMVVRIIRPHNLPMRPYTHNEKPNTKTPEPESNEIGEEFQDKGCVGAAHVAVGHYFGRHSVAEVDEAGYCEAGWSDGDELFVLAT